MYKIALCDDEQIHLEKINKDMHAIMDTIGVPYEIDAFTSGQKFLTVFSKHHQYDLLLLDIIMDGVNGIELAHKIRELAVEVATCPRSQPIL